MRLTCIGDAVVEIGIHPENQVHPGDETPAIVSTRPGGQAVNVARTFRWLGGRSRLYAAVGDDAWGAWLLRELRRDGVETKAIRTLMPTGTVVSLVQGRQRTMFAQRGANNALSASHLKGLRLRSSDGVYVSGYALINPEGLSLVRAALLAAVAVRALSAVDTPPAQILHDIGAKRFLSAIDGVQVLFATEDEAHVLTSLKGLEAMAASLGERFPLVVIKQAERGCWVHERDVHWQIPTTPIQPVDPTGAGDAFCAGFLYEWGRGVGVVEAAQAAHRVAAQVIARPHST